MLALPDYNTLIITPPKNGSSMLHNVLPQLLPKVVHIEGPVKFTKNHLVDVHTTYVPPQWRHLKNILIVMRHPVDRAISLFKHLTHYWGDYSSMTFEEFCRYVLHKKWMLNGNEFFHPASYYSSNYARQWTLTSRKYINHIQLENIEAELRHFDIPIPEDYSFPVHNQTKSPRTVSDEQRRAMEPSIHEWGRFDYTLGRYC